jgi:hypothetical protein
VCLRSKTTVLGVLEVAVSSIKLRFLYVLGSIKDCTVHVFLDLAILSRMHPLIEIRIVRCVWDVAGP